MPCSAEFRAGSKVSARLVRLNPEVIRVAGNGVAFAAKVRYPPAVNDIGGCPALQEFSGHTPMPGRMGIDGIPVVAYPAALVYLHA
jgi:hypothetical protein